MIKQFKIENFRGFQSFTIDGLKSLNVIIGKNNVGKTAFLEALFLHIGANNPDLPRTIDSFRGIEKYELKAESIWSALFYKLNLQQKAVLTSVDKFNKRRMLEISLNKGEKSITDKKIIESASSAALYEYDRIIFTYTSPKLEKYTSEAVIEIEGIKFNRAKAKEILKGMFISSHASGGGKVEADRYSALDIKGQQDIVLETLQKVEPRLKRLSIVTKASNPMIFGDIGIGQLIPLPYLGEGICKLLSITLGIAEVRGGIVLIDEMDRGFHYTIVNDTLKSILFLMQKFQVQLFITTHSLEFIKHIYQTFKENNFSDYNIIRFDQENGRILPTFYDETLLETVISDGWDIR